MDTMVFKPYSLQKAKLSEVLKTFGFHTFEIKVLMIIDVF